MRSKSITMVYFLILSGTSRTKAEVHPTPWLKIVTAVRPKYFFLKVGVNPEMLKNRKVPLTVMYVKVYISKMEMTQRIHFWHQNLLKTTVF